MNKWNPCSTLAYRVFSVTSPPPREGMFSSDLTVLLKKTPLSVFCRPCYNIIQLSDLLIIAAALDRSRRSRGCSRLSPIKSGHWCGCEPVDARLIEEDAQTDELCKYVSAFYVNEFLYQEVLVDRILWTLLWIPGEDRNVYLTQSLN